MSFSLLRITTLTNFIIQLLPIVTNSNFLGDKFDCVTIKSVLAQQTKSAEIKSVNSQNELFFVKEKGKFCKKLLFVNNDVGNNVNMSGDSNNNDVGGEICIEVLETGRHGYSVVAINRNSFVFGNGLGYKSNFSLVYPFKNLDGSNYKFWIELSVEKMDRDFVLQAEVSVGEKIISTSKRFLLQRAKLRNVTTVVLPIEMLAKEKIRKNGQKLTGNSGLYFVRLSMLPLQEASDIKISQLRVCTPKGLMRNDDKKITVKKRENSNFGSTAKEENGGKYNIIEKTSVVTVEKVKENKSFDVKKNFRWLMVIFCLF